MLLSNIKKNIYSFVCVPENNRALTLANNSIGFHYSIVEKAFLSIIGKFELVISGFHEFGHLEGLNSFKNQNYFNVTPKKFNFEAGNFLQIRIFSEKHDFSKINEKINENRIVEALILWRNHYTKNDLKEKTNPINFYVKEFDQDKVQKENLMDLIKTMYEKNNNDNVCAYSELRNTFLKGLWKLYEKKN